MKFIPIIVFLIGTFSFGQRSDFDSIEFDKADSIALQHKGSSLKNLPVLVHNLTSDLSTEVEKFRSIYTWVCTNIQNDYSSYLKTRKKRKKLSDNQEALLEWNNSFTPKVFENLLKYKKTACTGYAYLVREMAVLADINCEIVDGFGRTATLALDENSIPNHSWNAVELNGKWYLCDATWSAGHIVVTDGQAKFKQEYYDGYFLADPLLFIKNHFPLKVDWTLISKTSTFKGFMDGPIVYKEAFQLNVIPKLPSQMHLETIKNENVDFSFTSTKNLEDANIVLVLNNGSSSKNIRPNVTHNQEEYILKHTFNKTGNYDVHIKIDDSIMVTYVVRVKRK
ncbi:MAG: hypothetical protein AB8B59_18340 [Maribacter sp.]